MANRFLVPTRALLKYSKRSLIDCSEFTRIASLSCTGSSSSGDNTFAPVFSGHSSRRRNLHLCPNLFTESKDSSSSSATVKDDETLVVENKADITSSTTLNQESAAAAAEDGGTSSEVKSSATDNDNEEVIAFNHPISRFIAQEEAKLKSSEETSELKEPEEQVAQEEAKLQSSEETSELKEPEEQVLSEPAEVVTSNDPLQTEDVQMTADVSEEATASADAAVGLESEETAAEAAVEEETDQPIIDDAQQSDANDEEEKELPIVKLEILENALDFVTSHGWTRKTMSCGAEVAGYAGVAEGMFSNGGNDLLVYFIEKSNLELKEFLEEEANKYTAAGDRIPIRAFIRDAVEFRLRLIIPYIDAWPEAVGMLLHPTMVGQSTKLIGTMVDDVWHYAGDKSVDFNWYTKRGILAKVYGATQLAMLSDDSPDFIDTWSFLDRQLDAVMEFGKVARNVQESAKLLQDIGEAGITQLSNIVGMGQKRR